MKIGTMNIDRKNAINLDVTLQEALLACGDYDILGLTEVGHGLRASLKGFLVSLGFNVYDPVQSYYGTHGVMLAMKKQDGCVLGAHPIEPKLSHRWLHVRSDAWDLDVLLVHCMGRQDTLKFHLDQHGEKLAGHASLDEKHRLFHSQVVAWAAGNRDGKAVILGDMNAGGHLDKRNPNTKLWSGDYLQAIEDNGFADAYKATHLEELQARDIDCYTWFMHKNEEKTATRLDYIYLSESLAENGFDAGHNHLVRKCCKPIFRDGVSDHSGVWTVV